MIVSPLAFSHSIPPPLPSSENGPDFSFCLLPGLVVLGKDPGPPGSNPAPAPGHGRAEEEHLDRELVEFPVVSLGVDAFKPPEGGVRGAGFAFHAYRSWSIVNGEWSLASSGGSG